MQHESSWNSNLRALLCKQNHLHGGPHADQSGKWTFPDRTCFGPYAMRTTQVSDTPMFWSSCGPDGFKGWKLFQVVLCTWTKPITTCFEHMVQTYDNFFCTYGLLWWIWPACAYIIYFLHTPTLVTAWACNAANTLKPKGKDSTMFDYCSWTKIP